MSPICAINAIKEILTGLIIRKINDEEVVPNLTLNSIEHITRSHQHKLVKSRMRYDMIIIALKEL